MDYKLDDDIYTNNIEYFFSLHGPRFEYMNKAMAASLKKTYGREFRPIRILNAWPSETYDYPNYIVLNTQGYKLAKELSKSVVFLPEYEDVNAEFSHSTFISELASSLLEKQRTVYVYPFTTAFLELPTGNFTILGPRSDIAKELDNKVNQLNLFKKLGLPCNNVRIYKNEEELLQHKDQITPCFISAAYTSGGGESGLMYSAEMLDEFLAKLRPINKSGEFVVADIFSDIVLAPNVSALVTNTGTTLTLVLSDQILHGNRYLGNIYPTKASPEHVKQIFELTQKVGTYLAGRDFKGLFGCDFLINKAGDIVIVDLNPRHQGGYACNGLALASMGISLTDIELATLNNKPVTIRQEDLSKQLDFAWSHSKVVPAERGQEILSEFQENNIQMPFSTIGTRFITEFYKKGSVFIEGYIGYQVHTAQKRSEIESVMLQGREKFDAEVLGL